MVRLFFTLMVGFILGALVIENKALYSDKIVQPVAFLPDGGEYDGNLRKGVLNGSGIIIWPFGDRYEGDFKAGLYHGKGRLETAEMVYEGDFFEGAATGEATIRFNDGREYQGEVEAGEANGIGSMTDANTRYQGGFKNNLYHGEGELVEQNGRRYQGFFEEGVFSGSGQLTEADGSVFQGQFINGQLNGEGLFRNEIVRFSGEFKDGLFNGQGTYRDNKSEYIGEFLNGQFEGTGQYLHRDGVSYQGNFEQGQFSGKGVLETNGLRYEGGFVQGLKEGEGILYFAEPIEGKQSLSGVWRAGKLIASDQPDLEFNNEKIAETRLYNQQQSVSQALLNIVDQDPSKIDMYFLGIAGDGRQEVFRRDVEFVNNLFDQQFGTQQRSLSLVNTRQVNVARPLATLKSIEQSLVALSEKMDPNQDVLFLFISGDASRDGELYLEQPGIALENISAAKLGALLAELPIQNKIVMVSSCFAGGFIQPLKDNGTMTIVASGKNKKIFNCGGVAEQSKFTHTYFKDYFSQSADFYQAFEGTRDSIAALEQQLGYAPSAPLIFRPRAMVDVMEQWRNQIVDQND